MILQKLTKIKKILSYSNLNRTFIEVLQHESTKQIIKETIKARLYNKGTDIFNNKLRTDWGKSQRTSSGYSRKTERKKTTTHVTLFDKGDMYDSISLINRAYGLEILSNFRKENSSIFANFRDSFMSESDMKDKTINISETDKDIIIDKILLTLFNKKIRDQINEI